MLTWSIWGIYYWLFSNAIGWFEVFILTLLWTVYYDRHKCYALLNLDHENPDGIGSYQKWNFKGINSNGLVVIFAILFRFWKIVMDSQQSRLSFKYRYVFVSCFLFVLYLALPNNLLWVNTSFFIQSYFKVQYVF